MIQLKELGDRELDWIESAEAERSYDLRAGNEFIGRLRFDPERSRATGELEGVRWSFEDIGAGHACVIVRYEGSPQVLATFVRRWRDGGLVKFAAGETYYWTTSHIWSTTYRIRGGESSPGECISQEANSGGASRVTVCTDAVDLPETPVLVLLGWFLETGPGDKIRKATATGDPA